MKKVIALVLVLMSFIARPAHATQNGYNPAVDSLSFNTYTFATLPTVPLSGLSGTLLECSDCAFTTPASQGITQPVPVLCAWNGSAWSCNTYHNDFANIVDYGAKCDGVTNDSAAVLAAAQSVCSSGLCGTIYTPRSPSCCMITSTASTSDLSFNTSTLGSAGGAVIGLKIHGDGPGLVGTQIGQSCWTIKDNAAKVGLDMFGVGGGTMDGMAINEPGGATGPVGMVAVGKTLTSGAVGWTVHDNDFTTTTGQNTAAFVNMGAENFHGYDNGIKAFGGGHALVLSSLNHLGLTTTDPNGLMSNPSLTTIKWDGGRCILITVGSAGKPAYDVYWDTAGPVADTVDCYYQTNGPADVANADGNTSNQGTGGYYDVIMRGYWESKYSGANTAQFSVLGYPMVGGSVIDFTEGEVTPSSSCLVYNYDGVVQSMIHIAGGAGSGCAIHVTTSVNSDLYYPSALSITATGMNLYPDNTGSTVTIGNGASGNFTVTSNMLANLGYFAAK